MHTLRLYLSMVPDRVLYLSVLSALATLPLTSAFALGQRPEVSLPTVFANKAKGVRVAIPDGQLTDFELELRDTFARKDAPDEIFALAYGSPGSICIPELGMPVDVLTILVYGKGGELRWYVGGDKERYYYRAVSATEIDNVRTFVTQNCVDDLPELKGERVAPNGGVIATVGGLQYSYLRLAAQCGVRVLINNPPLEKWDAPAADPSWQYAKVTEFFKRFADVEKLEMRYNFCRPTRGLEVLYAPLDTDVVAVWGQGGDLCITLQKKWGAEEQEHRVFCDGRLGRELAAPKWALQRRVHAGGLTLSPACASPDGRWIVGNRREDGELVCYDQQQMKFMLIANKSVRRTAHPRYYLEPHGVFLLAQFLPDLIPLANAGRDWEDMHTMCILDPLTGTVTDADKLRKKKFTSSVDKSLWFQELPARLQPVRRNRDIVWIAIPMENVTEVGEFDIKAWCWRRREWIPNLVFETKQLWVDEPEQKMYVAYKGHLLRIPLPATLCENEHAGEKLPCGDE